MPARHPVLRRCLAPALLVVLGGCTSSPGSSVVRTPAPSSAAPTSAAPTVAAPAASPAGLSKEAFVTQANAWCTQETAEFKASQAKLTGIAAIPDYVDAQVATFTKWKPLFQKAVDAQPDSATLNSQWLVPRFADYDTLLADLAKLKSDAQAGDVTAVRADSMTLGAFKGHDAQVNPFLTGYGLTACAG